GGSHEEFEEILSLPHHMIFNRHWYERYEGRPEFDEYRAAMRRLSASERAELIAFLSARNPAQYRSEIRELPKGLRTAARFYIPLSKQAEATIGVEQRSRLKNTAHADIRLSTEEIVEDAGLEDVQLALPLQNKSKQTIRAA